MSDNLSSNDVVDNALSPKNSNALNADNECEMSVVNNEDEGSDCTTSFPKLKETVNCIVTSLENNNVYVKLDNTEIKGTIPIFHLSDDLKLSELIYSLLKKNDTLKDAVVISSDKDGVTLSLRPFVYHCVKHMRDHDGSVEEGEIFPVIIINKASEEIKVMSLRSGDFGKTYCINKDVFIKTNEPNLEEKYKKLYESGIHNSQAVFVKCETFENDEPVLQLALNLESSVLNKEYSSLQLLYNTLTCETYIHSFFASTQVKIGEQYVAKVLAVRRSGALVNILNMPLIGVIPSDHFDRAVRPKLNDILQVRILHLNYKEKCLELTAQQNLKNFFCKTDHNIEVNQESSCRILLAKREYVIGKLESLCEGQIVYLPSRRHINDFKGRQSFYEIDKSYDVVVKYVSGNLILCNLKDHSENSEDENLTEVIKTELPNIVYTGELPESLVDCSVVMKEFTENRCKDFHIKVLEKIIRVTQDVITKTDNMQLSLSKRNTLKEDNFTEIEDHYYMDYIYKLQDIPKGQKNKNPIVTGSDIPQDYKNKGQKEIDVPAVSRADVMVCKGEIAAALKGRSSESDTKIKNIVSCRVSSLQGEKVYVRIKTFDAKGYIPLYHLSDDLETSKVIYSLLKRDDNIADAVIISVDKDLFVLSIKPTVYQSVKNSGEDDVAIRVGEIFPAVVLNKAYRKIFIISVKNSDFGTKYVINWDQIVDAGKHSKTASKKFYENCIYIGQTLYAKCLSLKFIPSITSCLSVLMEDMENSSLQVLYNTLASERFIHRPFLEKQIKIGDKCESKVVAVHKCGALVSIEGTPLFGVIPVYHYEEGLELDLNDTVQVHVLYINCKERCLELTARQDFPKTFCKVDHNIEPNQEGTCKILLAKRDYIIGRLEDLCEGQIVFLPSRRHINDFRGRHSFYEIGKKYPVIVRYVEKEMILCSLKAHCKTENESINISSDIPKIQYKEENTPRSIDCSWILEEFLSDKHLNFTVKAYEKIERVSEHLVSEDTSEDKSQLKLSHLEDDNFSQIEDEYLLGDSSSTYLKRATNDNDDNVENSAKRMKQSNGDTEPTETNNDVEGDSSAVNNQDNNDGEERDVSPSSREGKRKGSESDNFAKKRKTDDLETWLKHIDDHVERSDYAEAKTAASDAIKKISASKTNEKYPLWEKAFNLEFKHGTFDSVKNLYQQSLPEKFSNLKVLQLVISFYEKDVEKADVIVDMTLEKLPQDTCLWLESILFYLRVKEFQKAKALVDKSVKELSKNRHSNLMKQLLVQGKERDVFDGEGSSLQEYLETYIAQLSPKEEEAEEEQEDVEKQIPNEEEKDDKTDDNLDDLKDDKNEKDS